jgi:REP element-mobilizing transposase RayT
MPYDPARHHRRSIRLAGYDYSQAGAYFVTIVTQNRLSLFGQIVDGEMHLSAAGQMVQRTWDEIPDHYPGVDIDAFVVMPNHVHGIIVLDPGQPRGVAPTDHDVGAGPRACPDIAPTDDVRAGPRACPDIAPTDDVRAGPRACPDDAATTAQSLSDVVHRFKTLTTRRYTDGVKQCGWPAYPGRVWQRNYYEHIIRDEDNLNRIRRYIIDNPARWTADGENPARPPAGKGQA